MFIIHLKKNIKIYQFELFRDLHIPLNVISMFSEDGDVWWLRDMAKELVKVADMNVVTVNWGDIVGGLYDSAVNNMYKAGN